MRSWLRHLSGASFTSELFGRTIKKFVGYERVYLSEIGAPGAAVCRPGNLLAPSKRQGQSCHGISQPYCAGFFAFRGRTDTHRLQASNSAVTASRLPEIGCWKKVMKSPRPMIRARR